MKTIHVGNLTIDGSKLFLIAGPCVIEGYDRTLMIGREIKKICERLGVQYIFKASYDKANRSSFHSFRGPGLEKGLEILADIKKELQVPVLSDVHDVTQLAPASKVLDMLQIPAFLCRQTDLVYGAAKTGKPVNVKKGTTWDSAGESAPAVNRACAPASRRGYGWRCNPDTFPAKHLVQMLLDDPADQLRGMAPGGSRTVVLILEHPSAVWEIPQQV